MSIENWKITNISYEDLLTDWDGAFIYLDPPYVPDDFTKYKNHNVKVKSENYSGRGKLISHSQNSLTLSNKKGETCLDLSRVLDIKIDLEGMSLESIKKMEFK